MAQLIEVAFKGNRREFFLWEGEEAPPRAASVIVDADRGEDLGRVHSIGDAAEQRSAKVPHGLAGAAPARVAKRVATPDDLARYNDVRTSDDDARRKAMERVKANALVMKITDAEWQWDRKKLTFYFTAEKRVDFRTLVRELAAMFRTRIELKQIGVRDEAKRLDGIGRCGRQYCSASWLPELRPVNLGVAKDQRLSLNPSQISGACGRLMCCLRYEHEFYVESRRKYPKEGKPVRTARGEEKVIANDIFRERVTLRGLDGEVRAIPLAELRAEMEAAGDPMAAALDAASRNMLDAPIRDETDEMPVPTSFDLGYTDEHPIPVLPVRAPVRPQSSRPAPPPRGPRPAPSASGAAGAAAASSPSSASRPSGAPSAPGASSTPSGAPSTAPAGAAPEQASAGEAAPAEGERRSQRRRGRRGGRRNRPSGGTSAPPDTGGAAPTGE